MKLTTRVINAFSAFSGTEKAENSIRNDATNFLRYGNRTAPLHSSWSQVEMSDEDMYTGYSYAAIKKRANRASALGKNFLFTEASPAVMDVAKKKEQEIVHPYLNLINKSKDFTTRKFWHDISTYLDLEGVYYLMAVRAIKTGKDGEPQVGEIQKFTMMNPYQVRRVVRDSDGTFGGYVESKNGMYREIPKEMVIEIRLLNPFNNDEAYSMTDAAKESQFTLKQAGDYTRNSIKGNVNAPGIISTDVVLDDNLFDNFISHVKNHDKGEPLYSNGAGGVHWEDMQIDLDKAALDKINEIHRSILFAVSGTSKTTLGIEESGTTRDTSQVQKDNFTEDAVMPQMEDVIDALNLDYRKWYADDWDKNEFEILLDNPLQSDREAELKDIEIRETELNLRESLIAKGYEYDIAAKYAHGETSLEELGEPTLEVELTPAEADNIAAQEIGIPIEQPANVQATVDQAPTLRSTAGRTVAKKVDATAKRNFVSASNRFVTKEQNERVLKDARKRMASHKKEYDLEVKKKKTTEKTADQPKPAADEEDQKKKTTTVTVKLHNDAPKTALNQLAARDLPEGFYDDIEIDTRAINDDEYRGCIMIDTEKIPVAQFVKNAEDDLFENPKWDQGSLPSENHPHTTLLYGLLNNGNIWKDKVDQLLEGWSMPTVTIKEVSSFDVGDSYAVIALLEPTPEIIDGHGRINMLPSVDTFSEYHPHITLAYIKHDADLEKWVKALGKKYNGQIVSTRGINYGDMPKESEDSDDEGDNSLKDQNRTNNNSPEAVLEASHSHVHEEDGFVTNSTLEKATNALDPAIRDEVILQEANLQNAVSKLEGDVQRAVIEALRNGDVQEAEELISEAQEEGFIVELAALFAAYYTILFPIYAAQLFAARLSQFSKQGIFAMTDEVTEYIKNSARKAAESHINTILKDFTKSYNQAEDKVIRDELIKAVQEKVDARDTEYVNRLPENSNLEDIAKAVDSGKFDGDPIYEFARNRVREGQGLAEIEQAIQKSYNNISKTRAKTIARHEASRVFNMSQYEADLQFLTESNNINNAYKRLRSRSGSPCAVCNLLIEKTTKDPIPFAKNFADLGTELTASYRKDNGKMAVQKIPISYEAIKAGNVHVNCNCEYELVIKDTDGKILNGVVVENPYKSDNKFDPTQKRDEDGKWTDEGVNPDTGMGKVSFVKANITNPDDYVKKTYRKKLFYNPYNASQSDAIEYYAGYGFDRINKTLRGQEAPGGKTKNIQMADRISKSMGKERLVEDTDLYRGMVLKEILTEGTVVNDKGFSSTSIGENQAKSFTGASKDYTDSNDDEVHSYLFKINAKKGQNVVIPALVNNMYSEAEMILPSNSSFKVNKVTAKDRYYEVEVDIL